MDDDPISPLMVTTLEVDGGTIACWEWLEGADPRAPQRHLLPLTARVLAGLFLALV